MAAEYRYIVYIYFIVAILALQGDCVHYEYGKTYKYTYDTKILFNEDSAKKETRAQQDVGLRIRLEFDFTPIFQGDDAQLVRLQVIQATLTSLHRGGMEGQLLDMVKFPMYFEYMDGVVGRVFAIEEDSVFCTNIKKGILSMFQVQAEPGERTELDVSGECKTIYTMSGPTIVKQKLECENMEIAGQHSNENKVFGITSSSSSTWTYQLENNIIHSIMGSNKHVAMLNIKSTLNSMVLSVQKLTLLSTEAMQESDKLPVSDFEAAVELVKTVTIPAAHLTSQWNVPQNLWNGNSYVLGDKKLFTTLVRTIGPISDVGVALVSFFKMNNWDRTGLLYRDASICLYCAMGIKAYFPPNNVTIMQSIAYPADQVLTNKVIDDYLGLIKQSSRVIFLCAKSLRPLMIRAYKLGMCNGEYLFIFTTTDTIPQIQALHPWKIGDRDDEIVKKAYRYLIIVANAEWKDETGKQNLLAFQNEVIERMSEPPWNSTTAKLEGWPAGDNVQYMYESMYLYGLWVNHSFTHGTNLRDGRAWLRFSKNLSFESIAGPCDIGNNGDKLPYFWFFEWVGEDANLQIVAVSEDKNTKLTEANGGFIWYTIDGLPPTDSPICGFFGEFCQEVQNDNTVIVAVACLSASVVIAGVLLIGMLIRRRKIEEELLQSIWKVHIADIEIRRGKNAGSRVLSKSQVSMDTIEGGRELHTVTPIANYKGRVVVVRTVVRRSVLAKDDLLYLKTMRELLHDNINPFIGACFDTPSPCVLFQYCQKGSLQEILENHDINLDPNFKYSLTMDLVQGMRYIHNSKLSAHGRLKSSNCLVDNRWMLKVTDYGIARFLDGGDATNVEEYQRYKDMLWTAPELLDNPHLNTWGTKEGDVYSFSIILHEIFYRMGTFAGLEYMTVKDVIGRVKNREAVPCRPAIFTDVGNVTQAVTKLILLCWHDNPDERPSFNVIRSYITKNIQQGKSVNIVDVILQRLEKYATNLEDLVEQRTQQLMLEKQKSDKLLYRMLPKSCAEKLKIGENVIPEIFESATVFFSDIVGFTTISSKSLPIQVVDLLNDLYICFDAIINKYDAYKVETIGDAYLVVSGIPARNGNLHSGIIADMSLDIVKAVTTFKIKHLPQEEVKVRIGNHTGSCCAGIVGLSMPRYCLFGDTVNTASRMESNGCAQKIHLSEATHLALHKLGGYSTSLRGEMEIKGKGLMQTYWLDGKDSLTECSLITELDNL